MLDFTLTTYVCIDVCTSDMFDVKNVFLNRIYKNENCADLHYLHNAT